MLTTYRRTQQPTKYTHQPTTNCICQHIKYLIINSQYLEQLSAIFISIQDQRLATFYQFYYQTLQMSQQNQQSPTFSNKQNKQDNPPNIIPNQLTTTEEKEFKKRRHLIQTFSKIQYIHNTLYDSFFLAVSILDTHWKVRGMEKVENVDGLACLMLALKYQEIYLPSIADLQKMFEIDVSFRQYFQSQRLIVKTIGYNLNLDGPHRHFCKFPQLISSPEKRVMTYFLLEMAVCEKSLIDVFSWEEILSSIQLLFTNLSMVVQNKEKISERLKKCSQQLIICKMRLQEKNPWLYQKYSKGKNYNCSTRPFPVL